MLSSRRAQLQALRNTTNTTATLLNDTDELRSVVSVPKPQIQLRKHNLIGIMSRLQTAVAGSLRKVIRELGGDQKPTFDANSLQTTLAVTCRLYACII